MHAFPNDGKKEGEGKNRKGEGGEEEEEVLESLILLTFHLEFSNKNTSLSSKSISA